MAALGWLGVVFERVLACMGKDVDGVGLSAQDVNVKSCTHFAPTL
ncbi:hypothetical protein HMPREF1871_00918 [Gemelliphila asaccharolytica]|uniref:Uncharacterized protein n=1 Tax=Gemelliphila asaccharolytica TaxID=502393 RepID=A0ABR5TKW7_9BACL|nr:hypothetical protein HMPREF1871_00918 [Gemella asaccharolytica]